MKIIKDLTGQRYGKLVALEIDEEETKKQKNKGKIWKCACDCGNFKNVPVGQWGHIKSCGCSRRKYDTLLGKKFNKLTVVSEGEPFIEKDSTSKRGFNVRRTWNCMCDCGKYKPNVVEKNLYSGNIKSCGCITYENKMKSISENLKYNTYDLSNEYGIGYDSNGKEFYFDLEDYELIKEYSWHVKYDGYVETVSRLTKEGKRECLSMHRIVMNVEDKEIHIDHKNHITNDNRKENLRIVTREQNQANAKLRIDNTSGCKGVYYSNTFNCWVASIQVNKKQYSKKFLDKDKAIEYRKFLEEKYQKQYSYENSIKGGTYVK